MQRPRGEDRRAVGHRVARPGDAARVVGGEKDVERRDFLRLPGPLHRHVPPEGFDLLGCMVEAMSGVQIGPGATQFTRTPRSATSWPRLAVKFAIAALVAE